MTSWTFELLTETFYAMAVPAFHMNRKQYTWSIFTTDLDNDFSCTWMTPLDLLGTLRSFCISSHETKKRKKIFSTVHKLHWTAFSQQCQWRCFKKITPFVPPVAVADVHSAYLKRPTTLNLARVQLVSKPVLLALQKTVCKTGLSATSAGFSVLRLCSSLLYKKSRKFGFRRLLFYQWHISSWCIFLNI